MGLALFAQAAGKASTSSEVSSLKVWSSAFARRRSRDAPLSQEDRPDLDGGVRVREREVALRRVAVKDLSISEAKRDAVSLEERARLRRAEHRIDSRTGLMIIGEGVTMLTTSSSSSRRAVELPVHGPDDAAP